jgi:Ca-activated chloride channel family protein
MISKPSCLLLFLLPCFTGAQTPQLPQPGATDEPYRFSTSVQMVVLQASVRTSKGSFVNGLRQHNFQVLENSQPQTVGLFRHHDSPVAIGLIVDNSGSMRRKHAAVLAAAKAFARSSNAQDQLFVVDFNEQVRLGLPATQISSASSRALEGALPATAGGGKTALYDALELGMEHVKELKQDKKALIVISDGGDNASTHTLEQVMADATNSDVVIYTIGLFGKYEEETNPAFLKQLAEITGGEAFRPAKPSQAAGHCKRIAQTIRNVYTIGYTPKNQELDGKFRAIQVKVKSPRRHGTLLVRTRAGYTAQLKSVAESFGLLSRLGDHQSGK